MSLVNVCRLYNFDCVLVSTRSIKSLDKISLESHIETVLGEKTAFAINNLTEFLIFF